MVQFMVHAGVVLSLIAIGSAIFDAIFFKNDNYGRTKFHIGIMILLLVMVLQSTI